jgi:hypothetical protein
MEDGSLFVCSATLSARHRAMSEEDIGEHNEQLSAGLESAAQRENRITVCCISTGFVRATDQDYR